MPPYNKDIEREERKMFTDISKSIYFLIEDSILFLLGLLVLLFAIWFGWQCLRCVFIQEDKEINDENGDVAYENIESSVQSLSTKKLAS